MDGILAGSQFADTHIAETVITTSIVIADDDANSKRSDNAPAQQSTLQEYLKSNKFIDLDDQKEIIMALVSSL